MSGTPPAPAGAPPEQNLPDISTELARTGLPLRFRSRALEARYLHEGATTSRLYNRWILLIFILINDAFFLPIPYLEPQVAHLEATHRFLILTPLWAAYAFADWRGWLRGWEQCVAASLVILGLFADADEIRFYTNPMTLVVIADTPLIQLVVITARLNLRQVGAIIAASLLSFNYVILHSLAVPSGVVPSLVLTSLTVSAGLLVFAVRVDLRERRVFLLVLQAAQNAAALAEKNQALSKLSTVDFLTGLSNRRDFEEALHAAWHDRQAHTTPLSLVLMDVDHFKAYNDTLGHQAGDACLRRVAAALARCKREGRDTLARYGGEEFALIIPGATLAEAAIVAERLRLAVLEDAIPHPKAGLGVVTISLGVACLPCGVGESSQLLPAADACLYAAKRQGRNCVATTPGHAAASTILPQLSQNE